MFGTILFFKVPNMHNARGNSRRSSSANKSRRSGGGRPSGRRGGNFRGGRGRGKPKTIRIDRAKFISKTDTLENAPATFSGQSFTAFGFNSQVDKNLALKGFVTTTEIQDKAIPLIMKGHDVLGISETGSGKTGAFLLPMLEKLLDAKGQKLLVVAPTRELAQQIHKEAISFIRGTYLNVSLVVGGESMGKQLSSLRKGDDIIIGTPGRIIDLIKRKSIKINTFNNIVVDEVDRMMDMGFIGDIEYMFGLVPNEKQSLFFSATLNKTVERVVEKLTTDFDIIKLTSNTPNKNVVQSVVDYTHNEEKFELLKEILKKEEVEKAVIFVETKRFADSVAKSLKLRNYKVDVIHGDKRQNVRKRVLDMFRRSKINVLVATNVAARGIDIDDITHVINLDEPTSYDEYIHRIGRTGRNGGVGTAYTFVKR